MKVTNRGDEKHYADQLPVTPIPSPAASATIATGSSMKADFRARNHPAYWAFLVHRVSGVLLALFLPLHFWALGLALQGEAKLETFLRWSDQPVVKLAETVLVILLAAHMTGGLRLLALEFLAWRDWQKSLIAVGAGLTALAGLAFLLNLL